MKETQLFLFPTSQKDAAPRPQNTPRTGVTKRRPLFQRKGRQLWPLIKLNNAPLAHDGMAFQTSFICTSVLTAFLLLRLTGFARGQAPAPPVQGETLSIPHWALCCAVCCYTIYTLLKDFLKRLFLAALLVALTAAARVALSSVLNGTPPEGTTLSAVSLGVIREESL